MIGGDVYSSKERWKLILLLVAVLIGIASLWYTNKLVKELSIEEKKKVELWAEATKRILENGKEPSDLNFLLKVIETNTTIPVILVDQNNQVFYRNLDSVKASNPEYLKKQIEIMEDFHPPLKMSAGNNKWNYIYYRESLLLTKLTVYPYIQLSVIFIFVLVAYMAFSYSRRAEQNKVWLGLSRETAHQLGTPTSSLMAWVELLKDTQHDDTLILELEKDVMRLNTITERFSKIGSKPVLEKHNIFDVLGQSVDYMQKRIPASVAINLEKGAEIPVEISPDLFGWVIENLIKNSLDAIGNKGSINFKIALSKKNVVVDISDTGKGISKRNFKRIFNPGFTTKARGWGLGLSLTKRIITDYHHGKIFVLQSELNRGTTIRILLPLVK